MRSGEAITEVPKELIDNNRTNLTSYQRLGELLQEKTDYKDVEHVPNSAQGYSPTTYIASAIAFFICRLFGINIWIAVYLARLFNFIVFLVCGYFSLKYIPIGKLLLFTYMCNPMFIHQAASVSCDSNINAFIIAYIAFTTYLILCKDTLSKKNAIIYGVLTFLVAMSKNVYMPIIFINIGLIFKKSFSKKAKLYVIAVSIICAMCTVGWYIIGSSYKYVFAEAGKDDVNVSKQLHSMLENKNKIPVTLQNTFKTFTVQWTKEFLGARLGYLEIIPLKWLTLAYGILMILSAFLEKNDKQLKILQDIWNILIAVGISALVLVGLYLTWTPIGAEIILGVQGRYFIPVAILVLMAFKKTKINYNLKYNGIIFALALAIINIGALQAVIEMF